MLIKMSETKKGSPNGIQIIEYEKDQEYDIPESLAKIFLKLGVCKMVTVPENKDAAKKESENKKGKNKKDEEEVIEDDEEFANSLEDFDDSEDNKKKKKKKKKKK